MAAFPPPCSTPAWASPCRPRWNRDSAPTTLEFKITFMRPVLPDNGVIQAEGTVLRSGRRAGYAEGKVTDAAGKLLAHATTSCLIFERPDAD